MNYPALCLEIKKRLRQTRITLEEVGVIANMTGGAVCMKLTRKSPMCPVVAIALEIAIGVSAEALLSSYSVWKVKNTRDNWKGRMTKEDFKGRSIEKAIEKSAEKITKDMLRLGFNIPKADLVNLITTGATQSNITGE